MTKLTDHETTLLGYLAQGYTQKEAAKHMGCSYKSLNGCVQVIAKKHKSLSKALEWYREQHLDQFEQDELPEPDEPVHVPVRCERCQLDMTSPGRSQGHRCIDPMEHIYRPHYGRALTQLGPNGKYTNGYGQGEVSVFDTFIQGPVGAGRGRK